ncbi:MAG: BrnT family toxin [Planctomycetes bacterium]|nr:BrnT family toxin [Planctomycetota bacterium]MBM4080957.1 BrnT family toxin [Planctomycetota bacterium]MBM4084702.1 BrnT family toxin [Planctomycetota bacterium]
MLEFEWDPDKARKNLTKHGVAFSDASTIFRDPLGVTIYDPNHSDEEDRYITIGRSNAGRILMVVHTERGDRIRIISARELTRAEREAYEDEIKRRMAR